MRGPDGRPLLTRREITTRLRISYAQLRHAEEKGLIRPLRRSPIDGACLYREADVESLRLALQSYRRAQSQAGETAARAFELFNVGKSLRDVVVELREPPELIRALREAWAEPDDVFLPGAIASELQALAVRAGYPWDYRDGHSLLGTLRVLLQRDRQLAAVELERESSPRARRRR